MGRRSERPVGDQTRDGWGGDSRNFQRGNRHVDFAETSEKSRPGGSLETDRERELRENDTIRDVSQSLGWRGNWSGGKQSDAGCATIASWGNFSMVAPVL